MVTLVGNNRIYKIHEFKKGEQIKDNVHVAAGFPVGICPKCGKELVVRNGKYGEFIACSGFKENGCKNTYNINNFKVNFDFEVTEVKTSGYAARTLKYLFKKLEDWLMMNHKAEIVELISKENVKLAKKLQKTKRESNREKISKQIEENIKTMYNFCI